MVNGTDCRFRLSTGHSQPCATGGNHLSLALAGVNPGSPPGYSPSRHSYSRQLLCSHPLRRACWPSGIGCLWETFFPRTNGLLASDGTCQHLPTGDRICQQLPAGDGICQHLLASDGTCRQLPEIQTLPRAQSLPHLEAHGHGALVAWPHTWKSSPSLQIRCEHRFEQLPVVWDAQVE